MATEYKRMQQLGGAYKDFDPAKMLARELQVITSGDPASDTGRSIYVCFAPGIVKRIVSYEDFETEMQNALEEIQESFTAEIQAAIEAANNAAQAANTAKNLANTAAARAETAAEDAEQTDVAQLVQKINTIQVTVNQIIAALENVISDQAETE